MSKVCTQYKVPLGCHAWIVWYKGSHEHVHYQTKHDTANWMGHVSSMPPNMEIYNLLALVAMWVGKNPCSYTHSYRLSKPD